MKKLSYFTSLMTVLLAAPLLQAAEGSHTINPMSDIIYPWINFIILLSLLIFLLKKPAKEFFLARSKNVAQDIEQAAHEKHEAEAKYLNYDRRLKNIESEMDALLQSLKKEGELARQKIVEEAQNSSKRIEDTSRWIVNQEIRKAKEALKEKSVQIIAERAEQLVRDNLQAKDRQSLVEKALNKLEGAA